MDENVIKRVQPHNVEAEKAVIGSMLRNADILPELADTLFGEDFYNKAYGIMYDCMVELYREGKPVEIGSLNNKLRAKNVPEEVSDPKEIANIMRSVSVSTNAIYYASVIQEKAIERKLIKFAGDLENECYLDKDELDSLLDTAEADLFKIVQQKNGAQDFTPISTITMNVLDEIQTAYKEQGKVTGLSTGFIDLDNMLTGMHGGELLLVAARPAMGKTAFVLNIAHTLAVGHNVPVALFSLEMSKEQLVSRMIAIDAMVDSKNLKLGKLSDEDWDKVIESVDNISQAPIYIDDNSSISIGELRSKCRKLKQKNNIGLIILDYLQLMSPSRAVESRQQFISEVSRAMKNIARELNVPVIALSQLSRAVDSRQGNKPVLSDLRESGAIEQDADVVMFIYRDEYYNPDTTTKPQTAEIIIAKQRSGETGSVDLRWIGKYTKFANPEKHYTN